MATSQRLVYSLDELRALDDGFRHLLEHGPEVAKAGICLALGDQLELTAENRTARYGLRGYDFMAMALDLWPWASRMQIEEHPSVYDEARMYPVPGGDGWDESTPPGMFRWDALEFCAGVCSLMLASREKAALIEQHAKLVEAEDVPALAA